MTRKCSFVLSLLLAGQFMVADTLPTFTASTVSLGVAGGGCLEFLGATGADFTVSGQSGNVCPGPWLAEVGFPFPAAQAFQPGNMPALNGGMVTLNGVTYSVALTGGFLSFNPDGPNPIVPAIPDNEFVTLTVPATATGTLTTGCFPPGVLPSCGAEFAPVADISFNLSGVITIQLSSFAAPFDRIENIGFVTTPEPSSFALFILGMLGSITGAVKRCNTSSS